MFVAGGEDPEQRHRLADQGPTRQVQLDPAVPLGFVGPSADGERAGHQQMGVQGPSVVEPDEQVLAVGVGTEQPAPGEVDTHETWITGRAPHDEIAGETLRDGLGQPAEGVTLGHGRSVGPTSPDRATVPPVDADPSRPPEGTLERRLGLRDAVVIGAGSMIGAGVFTVWSPAAAVAGSSLLLGVVVAGLVAWCNATSSAQLAAVHPESGGTYVYGRHRLGPAWGHVAGWGFVVGKTASCAAMALAFGAYAWPGHERTVAVVAVVAVAAVNLGGLERTAAVTKVLLVVSLGSLLVVVVAAWSADTTVVDRLQPFDGSVHDVLRSAGLIFFAFAGYARIATLGEEVRDPAVTIPKAIPRALGGVLVLYLVVGTTALAALPADILSSTDAPLRAVVDATGWSPLAPVVRGGAAVATLGVLLNLVPGVSRTVLAMARRRDLPSWFARVDHRRHLPVRAEATVVAVVVGLVVVIGLRSAITVSGVAVLTYYAITNAAALRLAPDERRSPRLIAVAGLCGCVVLIGSLPWRELAVGGAVLLGGVLVRSVSVRRRGPTSP